MSKERLGFNTEREMEHLKKIVNKDDSITLSSRFAKYLIEQSERFEVLAEQHDEALNQNERYREYLGRLQRASKRYPTEDLPHVINKIVDEALEESE